MVLHNNKWDRRAKHKYLKKHGLSAAAVAHPNRAERETAEDGTVNSGVDSSDINDREPASDAETSDIESEPEGPLKKAENGEPSIALPLPEQDELDPRLERMFWQQHHTGSATRPTDKTHQIQAADASEFQKATAGVERSKLNKAVRDRFGRSAAAKLRANPLDLDSDSDFDEFMDQLHAADKPPEARPPHRLFGRRESGDDAAGPRPTSNFKIDKEQQDFLDSLI